MAEPTYQGYTGKNKKYADSLKSLSKEVKSYSSTYQDTIDKKNKLDSIKGTDSKPNATKDAAKAGGNFLTDTIGNIGNFIKDSAIGIRDDAVNTFTGVNDVFSGQDAAINVDRLAKQRNDISKQLSRYQATLNESDYDKPEVKAKLNALNGQLNALKPANAHENEILNRSQKVDAAKTAAAAANTFLNVGTLGVGTGFKAAATQGGKAVVKNIARSSAEGAAFGAAGGLISTAGTNSNNPADYANAALQGAGAGALFGGGVAGAQTVAGKVLNKAFSKVPGRPAQTVVAAATPDEARAKIQASGVKTFAPLDDTTATKIDSLMTSAQNTPLKKGQVRLYQTNDGNTIKSDQFFKDPNLLTNYVNGRAENANLRFIDVPANSVEESVGKGGVFRVKDGTDVIDHINDAPTTKSAEELNQQINADIDKQAGKYDKSILGRAKDTLLRNYDPASVLQKIDDSYTKSKGKKLGELEAKDSLVHAYDMSLNSNRQFAAKLNQKTSTGESAVDLIKKYGEGTDASKEFNNYAHAKFDQEYRAKSGKKLLGNLSDEDLNTVIKDFESKNQSAVSDLKTYKAANDLSIDHAVEGGLFSKEEGERIKSAYENAVPLERVLPDDLKRPSMSGTSIGSIGKQSVTQRLEGNAEIPLSNSFDALVNRIGRSVSQSNRARLARLYLERFNEGNAKGELLVGAGNKSARIDARTEISQINKGTRYLEKKMSLSNRNLKKLETEINKLNKQGLKTSLKGAGKNDFREVSTQNIGELSNVKNRTRNTRAVIKSLITMPGKDLVAIQKKIANREPKLAAQIDKVLDYKMQIDANTAAKTDLRDVVAQFDDASTTGKQTISGIVDGEPYKLEVDPEVARAMQGLDDVKADPVLRSLELVSRTYQSTWVGVLNPVFAGISTVFYDTPISVINSKNGFRQFSPDAIKESFKSIKSDTQFQTGLARNGAQLIGGSQVGSFSRPSAAAIAGQKNIISKIKFNATHPLQFAESLDVFGGKLAGVTRTRVARAEFNASLRRGLSPEDALMNAAKEYNNVMPNFARTTRVVRSINAIIPFTSASVAGTRSFNRAFRERPISTSAKALGLFVAPAASLTAYAFSSPAGQEYYQDMIDSKNETKLSNNFNIVMPFASKDPKTGKWSGVYTIPLAPEFRPANKALWKNMHDIATGHGVNGPALATAFFDTLTGDIREGTSPQIDTIKIIAGEDPYTGKQIAQGKTADLPKGQQSYSTTSDMAKNIASFINGFKADSISPLEVDKLIGQYSTAGKGAKTGDPIGVTGQSVINKFVGPTGERATNAFYDTYTPTKAQRDQTSSEVTKLVQEGKVNEAKRKAEEWNQSLSGRFSKFNQKYGGTDAYDDSWDDMLGGLFISTSNNSFKAREDS